jgi:hypothetical protein
VCYADGARMCTMDELTLGCTAGTGCGHDADLVRSSDPCSPPAGIDPGFGVPPTPPYTWVSKGNPSAVVVGEADSLCVGSDTLHEVRCCSDVELPGYTQKHAGDPLGVGSGEFIEVDCAVWGESQFTSVGDGAAGCVNGASYGEARDICSADGARLCTKAEMERGCTAGTGCGHDADLVRTSDPCQPDYAWLIIGSSGSIAEEGGAACGRTSEMNEVRCCSDVAVDGYTQQGNCAVWAESQFSSIGEGADGCVNGADFSHAHDICQADGARLCSITELQDGCTRGTGCGHDADLIWTSTACDPTQGILGMACKTEDDFNRFTEMVNGQCCAAGACTDSPTGLPTVCDSACAEVVVPMDTACTAADPWGGADVAGYLADPARASIADALDTVVGLCSGGGH